MSVIRRAAFYIRIIACALVITWAVPAQTCALPPSGIISWWPFDETSGTTAADIVGNQVGSLVNGPIQTPGIVGEALRFNGSTSYVTVADNDLWALGARDFTIELWANFSSLAPGSVYTAIFVGTDEGPGIRNKWFFTLAAGNLQFAINGPSVGSKSFAWVPFSPTVGQWYHLAVTRNAGTYTIYINGIPSGSQASTDVIPNANAPLNIGQAESLGFMPGLLDELTIYNRALSQAELQTIVTAGRAGKCRQSQTSAKILPQLAFGGGWYTALYFTNTTNTPVSFTLSFIGNDGNPLTIPALNGSSVTVNLAARGSAITEIPNTGPLVQGYVSAALPAGVTGYGVFRQSVPGVNDQEAVVPLSGTTTTTSTLEFDDTKYVTGVAVVNLASVSTTISVLARDTQGNSIGTSYIPLAPHAKTAVVLRDLPGLAGVSGALGSVDFTASIGNLAALGLRFNGRAFTSIPTSDR